MAKIIIFVVAIIVYFFIGVFMSAVITGEKIDDIRHDITDEVILVILFWPLCFPILLGFSITDWIYNKGLKFHQFLIDKFK